MRFAAHFKPRFVPTLAAVVAALATALLGNWQLNRAAEKALLQQRIDRAVGQSPIRLGAAPVDPVDVDYLPVEAGGEFKPDGTLYVDNRVRKGVPGYEIVTPLRIDGSTRYVLVNRGWVKAGANRGQLPQVATPAGAVAVEGIALPGNPRLFELSSRVQAGPLWENVTVDRYRKVFGLDLQPIIIQQHNDLGDGLAREWSRPDAGVDRHRAYALQWFSMCAAIIVIYVIVNVRRASRGQGSA
ncbi:MAG TPA: SURF1 family protein [Burkholderiales bacterium]|nr:SURF1 family protein [Burkholderiales bacterium]